MLKNKKILVLTSIVTLLPVLAHMEEQIGAQGTHGILRGKGAVQKEVTAAGGRGKLAAEHHFLFIAFGIAAREKSFHLSLVPPGAHHIGGELVA